MFSFPSFGGVRGGLFKHSQTMVGINFSSFKKSSNSKSQFEQMLNMFLQLLNYTNGDASEALSWMNELDKQYNFTTNDYGMGNFVGAPRAQLDYDFGDSQG